jgi:hypothetical protein
MGWNLLKSLPNAPLLIGRDLQKIARESPQAFSGGEK